MGALCESAALRAFIEVELSRELILIVSQPAFIKKKRSKTGSSGASGVCIGIGIAIIERNLASSGNALRILTPK